MSAGLRGACAVPRESERYARGGRGWTMHKQRRTPFDATLQTFSIQKPRQT